MTNSPDSEVRASTFEERLAKWGTSTNFSVTSARTTIRVISAGTDSAETSSITLTAKIPLTEDITWGPDRKSLRGAAWYVVLLRAVEQNQETEGSSFYGVLEHSPELDAREDLFVSGEPESCSLTCVMPCGDFDKLQRLILEGRVPHYVEANIAGLSYGFAPDGSIKEWDKDKHPRPLVQRLSFAFPKVQPDVEQDAIDDEGPEAASTSLSASLDELKRLTSEALEVMKSVRVSIIVAGIIVGIAIALS